MWKIIKLTHLILVSKQDVIHTTQFLINHGANVNSKTDQGQTALTYASRDGFSETVKILVENRADVNSTTNNGFTALMASFRKKIVQSNLALVNFSRNTKSLLLPGVY